MAKLNIHLEDIPQRTVAALEKILASDPRVDEIENRDMDEGRFFIHLKPPYSWDLNFAAGNERQATQSFGTATEARYYLKNSVKKMGNGYV